MKIVKLISLSLKNFKGHRKYLFQPDGKNVDVHGDNGTYKTTLYDSFCYLLFGKDSSFKSNFGIKTTDPDGYEIPNLTHEVSGLLSINDVHLKLKKVYKEKFTGKGTKKRKTGNTTLYYIEDIEVSETEYKNKINEIATEEQFKLLTNPFYFSQHMKWQDRRKILLSLCGNIFSNSSSVDLAEVSIILGENTIEKYKEKTGDKLKELDKRLDEITAINNELNSHTSAISDIDLDCENDKKSQILSDISDLETKLLLLNKDGLFVDLTKQLIEEETKLLQAKNNLQFSINERDEIIRQKVSEKEVLRDTRKREILDCEEKRKKLEREKEELLEKREEYKKEWYRLNDETIEEICFNCGEKIPEKKFQDLTLKNNKRISVEREKISKKGKLATNRINKIEEEIKESTSRIIDLRTEANNIFVDISKIKQLTKIDDKFQEAVDICSSNIKEISEKIKVSQEEKKNESAVIELEKEIEDKRKELYKVVEIIDNHSSKNKIESRINELLSEQKNIFVIHEQLESDLFKVIEFEEENILKLESEVNNKFSMASVKMFSDKINGNRKPCCSIMYNGVLFEVSLNNGNKILVGLDIINTIGKHLGLVLPVFIDNAESVTKQINSECQIIRLIVDKQYKKLTYQTVHTGTH